MLVKRGSTSCSVLNSACRMTQRSTCKGFVGVGGVQLDAVGSTCKTSMLVSTSCKVWNLACGDAEAISASREEVAWVVVVWGPCWACQISVQCCLITDNVRQGTCENMYAKMTAARDM